MAKTNVFCPVKLGEEKVHNFLFIIINPLAVKGNLFLENSAKCYIIGAKLGLNLSK